MVVTYIHGSKEYLVALWYQTVSHPGKLHDCQTEAEVHNNHHQSITLYMNLTALHFNHSTMALFNYT